jgi:hypothetical protein
MAIVVGFAWLDSRRVARWLSAARAALARRALMVLLGLAAVLAVATYVDFGVFRYGSYLNEWDLYHYYLGTKYAPELGYTNLYGATLAADHETGLRYQPANGQIRDLTTAAMRDVRSVLAEAPRYRSRFSEARWREFVADVAWFKMQLPPRRWSLILADHGYNGTPAWSFAVGALLTRNLSVRDGAARWAMLLLDPLLLVAGVLAVAWAFGARAALLTVVFIGTHYLFSWGHLKGALLRTDFAVCSLLAVCLVKRGYYRIAGVLLGWAVLSRIFPAFLLLGPAVLLMHGFWRTRRWDRRLLGLLVAGGATVAVAVAGSSAYFGGTAIWREWTDKIALHYAEGSDWDLGLRSILEARFAHGVPIRAATVAALTGQAAVSVFHPMELVAILFLALPALWFIPALEHHEALSYGFVFVFLFSIATYYYYLILCLPFVFFAANLTRLPNVLGVAFMFLTGAAGYLWFSGWQPLRALVLFHGWRQTFPTYFFMSCLVAVSVAQMIVLAGARAHQRDMAARAARQPPAGG